MCVYRRVYPKVSGLSNNEINNSRNKHLLRSNTKGYGGKTHYTDSQNSDKTAPSGRELYHLQFSLQTASPETFDTLSYTKTHTLLFEIPVMMAAYLKPAHRNVLLIDGFLFI
jgi:hypothetical protein